MTKILLLGLIFILIFSGGIFIGTIKNKCNSLEQDLTNEKEARTMIERELSMLEREKEVWTMISPLSHLIIYAMDSRDLKSLRNNVSHSVEVTETGLVFDYGQDYLGKQEISYPQEKVSRLRARGFEIVDEDEFVSYIEYQEGEYIEVFHMFYAKDNDRWKLKLIQKDKLYQ
ncbi:MAG: hypothetical protein VR67_00535 [Peptococcaceae bacterium BRH_c8a]|nr:MAG: hypothetical protein VR67_00535 [Peptococcaceae bacterium BRH_c8a]